MISQSAMPSVIWTERWRRGTRPLHFCIRKTPCLTRGSKDVTRLTINPPSARLKLRSGNCNKPRERGNMGLNDINSLAYSKWKGVKIIEALARRRPIVRTVKYTRSNKTKKKEVNKRWGNAVVKPTYTLHVSREEQNIFSLTDSNVYASNITTHAVAISIL